jgi:flavin reductase (DIM6/NTAB) family NADH-FMN oxidoreductase RutF
VIPALAGPFHPPRSELRSTTKAVAAPGLILAPVVSGEELRDAMRRHAAGVCVVTAVVDGLRYGATVGSLVSLSLEPALVGVSIGLQSSFHEPLRHAGRFGVSLLAGDQARLAQHFGRSGVPPVALWVGVELHAEEPEPLLAGALAWLSCVTRGEHRAGDHTVFVAEAVTLELGRDDRSLVYVRHGYEAV